MHFMMSEPPNDCRSPRSKGVESPSVAFALHNSTIDCASYKYWAEQVGYRTNRIITRKMVRRSKRLGLRHMRHLGQRCRPSIENISLILRAALRLLAIAYVRFRVRRRTLYCFQTKTKPAVFHQKPYLVSDAALRLPATCERHETNVNQDVKKNNNRQRLVPCPLC